VAHCNGHSLDWPLKAPKMAFPWMVVKRNRACSWLYFICLLGCYITYCVFVTIQAFKGRKSPPVALQYDVVSPWIFPDLSFEFGGVKPDDPVQFCCQVYSVFADHNKFGSNLDGTAYLFHASNVTHSWNGSIWTQSSSQSPRQLGETLEGCNYCTPEISAGNDNSICEVVYHYSSLTQTLKVTFLLSQIAYQGLYIEDNVFNIQFVIPRRVTNEAHVVVQGPEVYPHLVSTNTYQTLILTRVEHRSFKMPTSKSAVSIQAEFSQQGNIPDRTVSFISLNPQGKLIQTEIDPVSVTALLAKYGGFWFFNPLLFGGCLCPLNQSLP
jgi:hypothetical protein